MDYAQTRWSDALSSSGLTQKVGGVRLTSRLIDSREIKVKGTDEQAFNPIANIGGENGWYAYDWLWRLRGFIDMLIGGVGVRRKRPPGPTLKVGDSLDFWRVEVFEPPHRLKLRAEMKVPGKAWLEFETSGEGDQVKIRQTAEFYPKGLAGLLYWYGIYPVHVLVFRGMLKGIASRVE